MRLVALSKRIHPDPLQCLPASDRFACNVVMACVATLPLRSAAFVAALLSAYLKTSFFVTIAYDVVATTTTQIQKLINREAQWFDNRFRFLR